MRRLVIVAIGTVDNATILSVSEAVFMHILRYIDDGDGLVTILVTLADLLLEATA